MCQTRIAMAVPHACVSCYYVCYAENPSNILFDKTIQDHQTTMADRGVAAATPRVPRRFSAAEAWYLPQEVNEFCGHSLIAYFQKCTIPSVTFRVGGPRTWFEPVKLEVICRLEWLRCWCWWIWKLKYSSIGCSWIVESPLGFQINKATNENCLFGLVRCIYS